MGINTFSTALSGLSTNTQGLNVVGNNLANMNTVGFKSTSINFTDVLGQTVSSSGGTSGQVGLGGQIGRVSTNFIQGGLETTNNATDLAIQGNGFFIVNEGTGNFYTRAGNFSVDADGQLVAATGHAVQGWVRDPTTGVIDTSLTLANIRLPVATAGANPTANFELAFNLDAAAPIGAKFAMTTQLYDSLGKAHLATVSFIKNGVSATETDWKFDVTVPHKDFTGIAATSTDNYSLITNAIATATPAAGTLVFDTNGKLKSAYLGATVVAAADLTIPPSAVTLPTLANSATPAPNGMTWKLVNASGDLNATGLASPSNVTLSTQDGVPPGNMSSLVVGADGTIAGVFSNGSTIDIAKMALASFKNENGLVSSGSGLFAESVASGTVLLGIPGQGGRGRLVSGALELSNVDLAGEFTKIITYQRGYQANARMITATDEILQETMNLKR